MNVTDYVARHTERMAENLAHFVATTPDDKLVWHPAVANQAPTRSVLEQISECVNVNRAFATLIRTGKLDTPPGEWPPIHFANGLDAQEQLVHSARELAEAIRSMSEADLHRAYHHPRGPILGENLILMGYRNMAYHAGQINFIQTLYGDTEFHVPPMWR
ncbi:MAG: DinB family protein [Chloroherpetonaceae bacterium]|nr:DinB family protein [Chthonomonadaceae bacterium]MDW8206774.1 DinB family protein [Chloroherpetonaceae bacterium]